MRALELRAYDGVSLVYVNNRPVPQPGPGEVLVRVQCAAVTEADLLLLNGRYGVQRNLPIVPGIECSGLVVQSGGGLLAAGAGWTARGLRRQLAFRWHLGGIRLRAGLAVRAAAQLRQLRAGEPAQHRHHGLALLDTARARGSRGWRIPQVTRRSDACWPSCRCVVAYRCCMSSSAASRARPHRGSGRRTSSTAARPCFRSSWRTPLSSTASAWSSEANAGLNSDLLLRALPTAAA